MNSPWKTHVRKKMNVKQVHDETGLDDGFFFLEFIIKCHLFLFLLRLSHLLLSREAIWTFLRFCSCEESLLDYLSSSSSSSRVFLVWSLRLPFATLRSKHKEWKLLKVVAVSCLLLGSCWRRGAGHQSSAGLCDHGGPTSHRFTHSQ